MVWIHLSSLISKDVSLSEGNAADQIIECADLLERLAKSYRLMGETLKEKKMKIHEVYGSAHCGSLRVDEIDTGRLKQYGLVEDYTDIKPGPDDPMGAFFIDPAFDTAIEIADEMAQKMSQQQWTNPSEELKPSLHPDALADLLNDIRKMPPADTENPKEYTEGFLDAGLVASEQDGLLQLDVDDLGAPINEAAYSRVDGIFSWVDPRSGEVRKESISNVRNHLEMATALISQLAYSAYSESGKVGHALQTIENSMRLVGHLLRTDYSSGEQL
jgi:hypothetical protein